MLILNPATEKPIAEVTEDTLPTITTKFELASAAQQSWQAISLSDRVEVMRNFAGLLKTNIQSLADILTSEVGKPVTQSRNEINGACSRVQWLTDNAETYLSDEVMRSSVKVTETIRYEPLGVVCNISAWNYPYLVGVNVFVPALMAGNAVIYKPSEYATLTGLEIENLLKKAGVPFDAFQLVAGDGKVGKLLLDFAFDGFFFTGSYETGIKIYEKVAPSMVPCQCELGGKDPLYVADDILNVEQTAADVAEGAFYNNGQSCCSVERIYVHEKIYDDFVSAFVKTVKGWKIGNPTDPETFFGPLTRKSQLAVIEVQVKDAVNNGAQVRTGGRAIDGPGYYYEPTVLTEVTNDMKVMQEESFGPVIGMMKVKSDDEAVKLMKDTPYGLTASVYSNSESRAMRILEQINAGSGYWNCCDRVSPALPWSGRGHSGIGLTLSHAGLRAFTRPKAYHLRKP